MARRFAVALTAVDVTLVVDDLEWKDIRIKICDFDKLLLPITARELMRSIRFSIVMDNLRGIVMGPPRSSGFPSSIPATVRYADLEDGLPSSEGN